VAQARKLTFSLRRPPPPVRSAPRFLSFGRSPAPLALPLEDPREHLPSLLPCRFSPFFVFFPYRPRSFALLPPFLLVNSSSTASGEDKKEPDGGKRYYVFLCYLILGRSSSFVFVLLASSAVRNISFPQPEGGIVTVVYPIISTATDRAKSRCRAEGRVGDGADFCIRALKRAHRAMARQFATTELSRMRAKPVRRRAEASDSFAGRVTLYVGVTAICLARTLSRCENNLSPRSPILFSFLV